MNNFIGMMDIEKDIHRVLEDALVMKNRRIPFEPLRGKVLGMLFEKPSLRTRVSFEVGCKQLGGHPMYLSPNEVGIGKRESTADVGNVLSRFVDIITYRAFSSKNVEALGEYATVPVINALDDREHPCQIMADLLTIKEHKKDFKRKIAYIGDGNNVCNSLLLGSALVGMDISVATPEGYGPDKDILAQAKAISEKTWCTVEYTTDPVHAVKGADAIYTDTWVSMGDEAEKAERLQIFQPYQVNKELVEHADDDYIFMHCLPAHRGEEVSDEIIDGPHSVIFDEAENRMHAQKAVMLWALGIPVLLPE
jgi:ornithine carbamoyltransferase